MTDNISLLVDGRRYFGWKTVRITRSIESLSGSFSLDALDRWGSLRESWPILEEDQCQVQVSGTNVITGYVDKRSLSISSESRTLNFSGRDKAAALVDCSAIPSAWSFRTLTLLEFSAMLAQPFGVRVSVQPGLRLDVQKFVVSPGETVYESIHRGATAIGVLLVSDGNGGIRITRSGSERASSLVEGQNVLSASVEYDGSERFRRYVLSTQSAATDESFGQSTRVKAEAFDPGVRRSDRVLLIRPDRGYSVAEGRRRADWEARVRAAKADQISVTVQGWTQTDGNLWPVNAICSVRVPSIGVIGDLLISQVEYSISSGGQITTISLVRPDAFTPEPTSAEVKTSGGRWKELNRGAL